MLSGYEDSRRSSKDGVMLTESTRINKSLYAIMNVVCALNTNEKRVPYREGKLTRMLQESLGGSNHVLLLTCLVMTSYYYMVDILCRLKSRFGRLLSSPFHFFVIESNNLPRYSLCSKFGFTGMSSHWPDIDKLCNEK